MLRQPKGARRYNEKITLTRSVVEVDEFGHKSITGEEEVLPVWAYVRQMSAAKTMLTFQQADVVGLDIEFRKPAEDFDGIEWKGRKVIFSEPEDIDGRGRILRVSGYYQKDRP